MLVHYSCLLFIQSIIRNVCSYPTVGLEDDGGRSHWSSHHHPRTALEKVKAYESCGPISQSPVELSAFLYPDHFNVRFFCISKGKTFYWKRTLFPKI